MVIEEESENLTGPEVEQPVIQEEEIATILENFPLGSETLPDLLFSSPEMESVTGDQEALTLEPAKKRVDQVSDVSKVSPSPGPTVKQAPPIAPAKRRGRRSRLKPLLWTLLTLGVCLWVFSRLPWKSGFVDNIDFFFSKERSAQVMPYEGAPPKEMGEHVPSSSKPVVGSYMQLEIAEEISRSGVELTNLAQVLNIRPWLEGDHVEIGIDLDRLVDYKKTELLKENVIFVSLANSRLSPKLNNSVIPVSSEYLKTVRLVQYYEDTVRVYLDIEGRVRVATVALENPPRIFIAVQQ
jgi:hypothetical protein